MTNVKINIFIASFIAFKSLILVNFNLILSFQLSFSATAIFQNCKTAVLYFGLISV